MPKSKKFPGTEAQYNCPSKFHPLSIVISLVPELVVLPLITTVYYSCMYIFSPNYY